MKKGDIVERDKACIWCGCVEFLVEEGKGPHAFHLRCTGCRRGGIWSKGGAKQEKHPNHPDQDWAPFDAG